MTAIDERLLAWPQVEQKVPYTRQHIYRLERAGEFPRRVQVGANRVAWRESEINAWIESRQRGPMPVPKQAPAPRQRGHYRPERLS